MTKGRWKNRLLCGTLSLAMMAGVIADIPSPMTVLAAEPTEAVTEAGEELTLVGTTGNGETYLAPANANDTLYSLISHDYNEIKAALESDRSYYIRLDGDVSKTFGKVKYDDAKSYYIACDVFSLGLLEILWNDFAWVPIYVDDEGHEQWRDASTPEYIIQLGAGQKILELDGHDFDVYNLDFFRQRSTLFQVNEGTSLTIKDDTDSGEVYLDGYIFAFSDYDVFKEKAGGDMQRDIVEVNGGSFTLNGGTLHAGRSKSEAGLNFFNATDKKNGDHYTGSATKYVNGTAIRLNSGEVTINKGTLFGRGYEEINAWHGPFGAHTKNGVIEAASGKITFNDGYVKAKGGADCFQLGKNVDITVRAGKFSVHRNEELFCGYGNYSDLLYTVDTEQTFGNIGIPDSAFTAQTWIEYDSGYNDSTDLLNSSKWRSEFDKNVCGHHGKDDREPWICVYPDGGWGTLTAVANPDPEIPELNPKKKGQLYFEYNLVSAFDFIPEEVRRAGGWKREYEFMIYDENGVEQGLEGYKTGMSQKFSFGRDECNKSFTWEYFPGTYNWANSFTIGRTFYVVCIMKETYYGSRTYTATTMAGRKFVAKDIKAPDINNASSYTEEIKIDAKGDTVTLYAFARHASEARWYKKTKYGEREELPKEDYTLEFLESGEYSYLDSKLTTKVDEEADYYCVLSNTVGSVTYKFKVSYPVSFVYTETTLATVYKSLGGEISAPIDGTLDSNMYYQWYYCGSKVNDNSIFTVNGNRLYVPANNDLIPTPDNGGTNAFYCKIMKKVNGGDDIEIATSPIIAVDYVNDPAPEKEIDGIIIGGLSDYMYVGQKAPTAEQIYVKYGDDGIDPRIRVNKVTVTGVNDEGIIISRTPSITIQLETTSTQFHFKSREKDYDHYGDVWYVPYYSGRTTWGIAKLQSKYTFDVNVKIDYDGSVGHYTLDKTPDTVLLGQNMFEFVKGQYYDIPLDFGLDMDSYALSQGEKHYISNVEPYSASSYEIGWPEGLNIYRTGTKTNAYGQAEPTYSLRGTINKTYSSDKYTFLYVTVQGDEFYPNGKRYGVRMNYRVVAAPTVTAEEAEEIAKTDAEVKAAAHVHEMLDWCPTDSRLDKYTKVHQRVCKYYDMDYDENGVDLDGGCFYVEEEPHDFYDVEILTEATANQPGTKRCRCAVCGLELEREYTLNPEGHVVTIDLNLGEGYDNQTKDVDVPDGELTLPAIVFEHPDGRIFGGWLLDDKVYKAGETIQVKTSLILKVRWVAETLDNSSPKLIGASASEKDITVKWTANPGVPKYAIFRKTAGGKWGKIGETTGSGNENEKANAYSECKYVDETAQPGVSYFYTVRGMNKAGSYVTSYNTVGVSAKINAQLPALDKSSPKLLATDARVEGIQVYWTANAGVFQYAVFRKVNGGKWLRIDATTGTGNESASAAVGSGCYYLDKTAESGVTYYYTVRGMDKNGKYVTSYDTNGVSGSLTAETVDKSNPKLLGASSEENGIKVTWTANSGVFKYAVFRKPKGGNWGKLFETTGSGNESVKATAGSTCEYLDATAEDGKTYTYSVRGMDKNSKYLTSYDTTGVSATYVDTHVKPAFCLSKDSNPAKGGTIMIDMTAFELLIETDDDWMLAFLEDEISYAWYAEGAVIAGQTGTSITVTDALSGKTVYAVAGITGKTLTTNSITIESFASEVDASSPKLIKAEAAANGITFTWTANAGVYKYTIFRKVEGSRWEKLADTTGTQSESAAATAGATCSYVDETAEEGVTYFYTARGMNKNGKYVTSYDTTGVSATMVSQQEEQLDKSSPVLLGATASGDGITITWKANGGVFKYQVFRKVEGGKWGKLEVTTGSGNESVKATAGSTCSFTDANAEAGVTYYYTVRGMDANGSFVTSYDTTGVSCTR